MNEKVEDLLIRLSKIPSATSLATELRSVLKTECVVIDREWLKENIVYHNHNDNAKPTYAELLAENGRLKEENEKLSKISEILKGG